MKRFILLLLVLGLIGSTVIAESSSDAVCPADVERYLALCEDRGISVRGTDPDISTYGSTYEYSVAGLTLIYSASETRTKTTVMVPEHCRPWAYISALQIFAGMDFEEATAAYCDMMLIKTTSEAIIYKYGSAKLRLASTLLSVEVPHE